MFDLVDRPSVWIAVKWPGLIRGPDEDGLAVSTEFEIEIEIDLVDRDEVAKLFVDGLDRDAEVDLFKRVVHGWRKFKIAGKQAEFNDENIRKLLAVPMFATGFETSYLKAWQGKAETREKNSSRSPDNGRAVDPAE